VIAILRYAFLKSLRDRSLMVFLAAPAVVNATVLLGTTLAHRLTYPLYIIWTWSPRQNAEIAGTMATLFAVLFAGMAAFWTFRPEISSRAISSFMMGTRPVSIAAALILFAAITGTGAWIADIGVITVLTGAVPRHLALLVLLELVLSFTAASVGALAVMISAQPAMIIWAFAGSVVFMPWLASDKKTPTAMAVAIVVSIVCTAMSAFLLERRCAT
jgi:hypothetical protein